MTTNSTQPRLPTMEVRAKVSLAILLAVVLILGLWQLSSPTALPTVGTKYVSTGPYSRLGSWTVQEALSAGQVVLAFSVTNVIFPRTSLSTTYSVVISKVSETVTSLYVRSLSLRVTSLTIEDNYDGLTTSWGKSTT